MLQSSTPSSSSTTDRYDNRTTESLCQLRVKICSVRLPSSNKLVDICVIMEVDNKYTYRTEIIRKKGKTNTNITSPIIIINESFDVLVTKNSKIKLKVHAPTRLFGNHDIGQLQFNIKSIIDDYHSSEQIDNNNDTTPSYLVKLPFDNSTTTTTTTIRSNDVNNLSNGIVEIIFYGSLLKQKHNENQNHQNSQQVKTFLCFQSIEFCFLY